MNVKEYIKNNDSREVSSYLIQTESKWTTRSTRSSNWLTLCIDKWNRLLKPMTKFDQNIEITPMVSCAKGFYFLCDQDLRNLSLENYGWRGRGWRGRGLETAKFCSKILTNYTFVSAICANSCSFFQIHRIFTC